MASRFKRKPKPRKQQGEPDPKAVARFGAGARQGKASKSDIDRLRAVNVRLSEAELEILRRLAKAEDRSMQRTIRRLLMSAADAELKRIDGTV